MSGLGRGGLYLITDGGPDLLARVEAALSGGVGALQYRDKSDDAGRRHAEAEALAELCRRYHIPFIVNDDPELALAVGADGVHLGLLDASISTGRARMGADRVVGASCYNSLVNAQRAVEADADYVAFGAFFPSRTKPDALRAEVGLLRKARIFGRRVVAIGGITADNAAPLLAAGADWLAVCADVLAAPDPALAAARYLPLFERRLH